MVLVASLDIIPKLLMSASHRLFMLFRISLMVDSDAILPPFTGKVVRSLLIKAEPRLQSILGSGSGFEVNGVNIQSPKPIHVSTLFKVVDGSEKYLWKSSSWGDHTPDITVSTGEIIHFYIGFDETISHLVLSALSNIDYITLFNTKWYLIKLEMLKTVELPSDNPEFNLGQAVTVELKTPTLPIDPYKRSHYKRFLPLAGILFAYNIGDLLRAERGTLQYITVVNMLNAYLTETHKIWDTMKRVHYIYEGKKLPALYGRVTYIVDEGVHKQQELKTLIENIIVHAQIMGVGSSRAIGFGHIKVKTHQELENKNK